MEEKEVKLEEEEESLEEVVEATYSASAMDMATECCFLVA